MIWAQQTLERVEFMRNYASGAYGVKLHKLPHYAFVQGNEGAYADYLRASWQTDDQVLIDGECERYRLLIDDIRRNGVTEPVLMCGDLIVDGNHRLSICDYYGLDCPKKDLTIREWVDFQHTGNNRYSRNQNGFYQSFKIHGEDFTGRRGNGIWKFIRATDIHKKSILDLGCNIGVNSYVATRGGGIVLGVEVVPELITFALRLNNFYHIGNVSFEIADLNRPITHDFHTVFCFSVDYHVENKDALKKTLMQAQVIYFECHEGMGPVELDGRKYEKLGQNENRDVYRITR